MARSVLQASPDLGGFNRNDVEMIAHSAKTEAPTTFWAAAAGAKDKLSWVSEINVKTLTAVKCSEAVLQFLVAW